MRPASGGIVKGLRAAPRWLALLIVFAVVAEFSARIDDVVTWRAPLFQPYSEDRLTIRDSLGVRGRPNYRFQKWRMNNEGFRGPDIPAEPAPGITRVVVLGASESFGLYESEGREYPAQMQAVLDTTVPGRFEVVNAALPGMGLPAMDFYYRHVVSRLRPAVVVLYPSPSFYLDVTPMPSVYVPSPTRPEAGRIDPELLRPRVVAKGREVLKEMIPAVLVRWYRERTLRRVQASHDSGWVWNEVPTDRMALFREHLGRLVATIQESGAMVLLATHTNRYLGASPEDTRRDRGPLVNLLAKYHPRATPAVAVAVDSAANLFLREVANERRVTVVEVEKRIPPTPEYFADYSHFTNRGASSMAHLLVEGLSRAITQGRGIATRE